MPRAHVMIRPFQKEVCAVNDENVEAKLGEMMLSKKFLQETGVIFEYYMRVFGWPDFVVSLYGPNEGMLKRAILCIREKCGDIVTSTIVGACPEDQYLRVAEFRNQKLKDLLVSFEEESSKVGSTQAMAKLFAVEEAKNYLKLQLALLNMFNKMLGDQPEYKNYKSGLEADKKLFRILLTNTFLNRKKDELSSKERDALLDEFL